MFKVANFESNNVAESACKELFSKSIFKKKLKSRAGKIVKRKEKSKIEKKEKITNALKSSKIKKNPKKSKINFDAEQNTKRKKQKKQKNDVSLLVANDEEKSNKFDNPQNTLTVSTKSSKEKSLRTRMLERLQSARFRFINEQMYSSNSKEAQKLFSSDPETFQAYHEGYRQQVNKWPLNPLDIIIKSIQKMPKTHVIADFGCGDANLARSVTQKVHSFDLVSTNELVTACDMAHVPLQNNSVDVVVFCLSLMGTNLHDYLLEANRVLKEGGILKIAEVESRFEDVQEFIEGVQRFHFKQVWKDLSHNLFYFLDFKKESNIKNKKKLPTISLNPCLYKKR